jgi:hypothetical protein
MEGESNRLEIISEIYTQFTKKNKENFIKSASSLLKVQKEDAERVANVVSLKNEGQNEKLV